MNRRLSLLAALGLGVALSTSVALAQQPPPNPPGVPPGVQVVQAPGQPPGGIQVRKIDPKDLPPQFRAPGAPFDPSRPNAPGGRPLPPGARPGRPLPPGFNPQRFRPPAAAHPVEEHSEHGGGAHHCPGHGPNDPPAAPNWWRGILMVNNELAESKSPLLQLLFRFEDHGDPCNPKNQPPPFLANVLNFGILAFLLVRFGKKPLAEALLKRKNEIMHEIDSASELKENAENRLEEYEQKLDTIEETLEGLRAEFATQAEQEKKHVIADAEERRARMLRDAEFRIEQELKSARAELLQEAVIASVTAAEALLQKRVNSGDLDRMAEDYLKTVGAALKSDSLSSMGDRA